MIILLSLYYEIKTSSEEIIDEKSFLSFDNLTWHSYIYLAYFSVMYIESNKFWCNLGHSNE